MTTSNGSVRTRSKPVAKPRPAPAPKPEPVADAPAIPLPTPEDAGISRTDLVEIAQQFAAFPPDVRVAALKLATWEALTVAIVDATVLLIGLNPDQRRRVANIADALD